MADSNLVTQALQIARARYPDQAKRDITQTLAQFTDLTPGNDNYVFTDGSRKTVVALNGTIPVNYKGASYNIPVCIYILDTHPYHPPIPYVRPTATMAIRVSQHVDSSGRVYLPYLHEWKQPHSDLVGLIQVMAIVFGESCPVFSRTSSAGGPGTPPTTGAGGYPPYPAAGGYMPMPSPAPSGNYTPFSGGGSPRPPYPNYGPGASSNPPYPNRENSSNPPYPAAGGSAGQPPYPSAYGTQTSTNTGSASQNVSGSATITSEHLRLSLISAVQDKVRRKLYDSIGGAQAELQVIKNTRDELSRGDQKLQSMVQKLQVEQSSLESTSAQYLNKTKEIDRILESVPPEEELNIDEAIDTTAPLYRQLLRSYAEDNAIEDAIYFLGESLRRQVTDMDGYLKAVRKLSRQQFMLRATMFKCREKAGLR